MKGQMNYMIQSIKNATTGQYAAPPPQPAPQQAQQQAQQQPAPQTEPEPEVYERKTYEPKVEAIRPDIIVLPKRRGRPKS
jgi:cytochrome c5